MEKIARPFRVCVTGAESTGKSELAKELSRHFRVPLVPEHSREYAQEQQFVLSYSDVGPIAHGQIEAEDRVLVHAEGLVILDTDLVSTVVYSRHHFGAVPEWIESAAGARLAELYLLLDIDVPWVWDPVRDCRDTREELQQDFHRALEEFGATYISISGNWEERLRGAIEAVSAKLAH